MVGSPSMIERVAMAIHRAIPGREESPVDYTPYTMLLARVAFEALREPTREMLMASGFATTQKAKWQAMIDEALRGAALSEGEG